MENLLCFKESPPLSPNGAYVSHLLIFYWKPLFIFPKIGWGVSDNGEIYFKTTEESDARVPPVSSPSNF
jgi:hypothetical protein